MKPVHEEDAIALRKTRFSESSLIVTWLGADSGKIKTSVRGALRAGSNFAGRVDLFHETRIIWSPPKRGDIAVLSDAEICAAFLPPPSAGFRNFQYAAYFCELVEAVIPFSQPAPELFDLLRRALRYLSETPAGPGALERFERQVVRILGIAPEHDPRPVSAVLGDYIGHLPPARSFLQE